MHDGQMHGGEAEELRSGLETLLEEGAVCAGSVRRLLDRVDARDSLAHAEKVGLRSKAVALPRKRGSR